MARIVDPEEREVEALRRLTTFRRLDVLDVGCGEGGLGLGRHGVSPWSAEVM